MDNFFEIIIYLFIIASLVSSFKKKKKKSEEKVETAKRAEQNSQTTLKTENKKEQSSKDILEEIQNLFNPPAEKPSEQKTSFEDLWKSEPAKDHYKETKYHEPVYSEHKATRDEHVETLSEHTLSPYDTVKKPEQTVVTRLLDDLDDRSDNYKTKVENKTLLMIRNELRKKSSIKNYIVVSEILGKPKALRR